MAGSQPKSDKEGYDETRQFRVPKAKPVLDGGNSHQGAPDKAEKTTRSKMDAPGDNYKEDFAYKCLSDAARTLSALKVATCPNGQCTSIETSNLLSECTSEESFFHNGKSEITFNASAYFGGLETLARAITDQSTEEDLDNFKQDTIPASGNLSNQCTNQEGISFNADCSLNMTEALLLSDTSVDDNSREGKYSGIHQQGGDSVKSGISIDVNKGAAEAENFFQHKRLTLGLNTMQKVSDLRGTRHSRHSHYSDVPIVEVEVKVCDTCGDAGREHLLALCSKCSDGAQHTYCMQIKLQKVPEGDWMCEECTQKETSDKQMQAEINKIARTSLGSSMSGRKNSFRNRNNSASRCTKSLELNVKHANERKTEREKIAAKPKHTNKRPASNSETSSLRKRRVIEVNYSSNSLLESRSYGKVVVNSASNLVRACNPCNKVVANSASSLPVVSSLCGKTGVKSMSSSSRSGRPCNNMVLSRRSSLENFDVGKKKPDTCMSSLKEQSKDVCENERKHAVSPQACPKPQRLPLGSLTKSNSGSSLERAINGKLADHRVPQKQKFNKLIFLNDRFDNSGSNSMSKTLGMASSVAREPQSRSSGNRQPNMKVALCNQDLSNSSKGHVYLKRSAHRIGHARTSNVHNLAAESSNVTEVASLSKISDRSKDSMLKLNETDDSERAFEAGLTERGALNNQLLTDRSLVPVNGVGKGEKKVAANVHKELNSLEAATREKDESGNRHKSPGQSKASLSGFKNAHAPPNGPEESQGSLPVISDGGPSISGLHNSPYISETTSCLSWVHPEYDCKWKGEFEIRGDDRVPKLCYGLQAHLSSSASGKVIGVVEKFPRILHLEAVSHASVWPKYVHTFPTVYNIGICIFAQGSESFDTQLHPLVVSMINNEVALKGYVDGIEVLIFTSNILPERQWNGMLYLWAIFKETSVVEPPAPKYLLPDLNELRVVEPPAPKQYLLPDLNEERVVEPPAPMYLVPDLNELPADEDMQAVQELMRDEEIQTNIDGRQT